MWNRTIYVLDGSQNEDEITVSETRQIDKDSREIQTLLIMGGVTFFITIVIILSKFEMSSESVMNYAPIIWLIGVIALGAILNTIDYYKTKRRQKRQMNVERLLADMSLPHSFPCLLPGPHEECCGGRGIPTRPLPTYDELVSADETIGKGIQVTASSAAPPPDYSTALSMLRGSDRK